LEVIYFILKMFILKMFILKTQKIPLVWEERDWMI